MPWRSLREDDRGSTRGPRGAPPTPLAVPVAWGELCPDGAFSPQTVAMLTAKERASRLLHHSRPRERLRTGVPLLDVFAVVGAPPALPSPPASPPLSASAPSSSSSTTPPSTPSSPAGRAARVLFQHPPHAAVSAAALAEFCFPEGAVPAHATAARRTHRRTRAGSFTPARLAQMAASLLAPAASRHTAAASLPALPAPPADADAGSPTPLRRTLGSSSGSGRVPRSTSEVFVWRPAAAAASTATGTSAAAKQAAAADTGNDSEDDSTFVFLVTGHTHLRYGVCRYVDCGGEADAGPLCCCIVSAAPFLALHAAVLATLAADARAVHALVAASPQQRAQWLAAVRAALAPYAVPEPVPVPVPVPAKEEEEGKEESKEEEDEEEIPRVRALSAEESAAAVAALGKDSGDGSESGGAERVLLALGEYAGLVVEDESYGFHLATRAAGFAVVRPTIGLGEETELVHAYAGELVFRVLPTRVLLQVLAAVLLEYKVVVVARHYRLLSTAVLGLVPLLRPFEYPSSVVPILPTSLLPYLDAPVPLLVGCTEPPPQVLAARALSSSGTLSGDDSSSSSSGSEGEHGEAFLVVNLETGAVAATRPVPALPDGAALQRSVDDFLRRAGVPAAPSRGVGRTVPARVFARTLSPVQQAFLGGIFQSHLAALVHDFAQHCISDVGGDRAAPTVSVFMKESYLATRPAAQHAFLDAFLDTQMFKCYEDRTLRDLDRRKTADRNSLRAARSVSERHIARPHRVPPARPPPHAPPKDDSLN